MKNNNDKPNQAPSSGWSWKSSREADTSASSPSPMNMLYEPGNWGDVLKGTWALLLTEHILESTSRQHFCFLDPYAGAPSYPLTEEAARRLSSVAESSFARGQEAFRRRGQLASTAGLVRECGAQRGVAVDLAVFDADSERRAAWRHEPRVELLNIQSGIEALTETTVATLRPDLILVDPYDLFDHWGTFLRSVLSVASRAPVLAYFYNKAPRGAGHLQQYEGFRRQLDESVNGTNLAACVGRLAADAVLPRAYHEMLLVGSDELVSLVKTELAIQTRGLACRLAEDGAFDDLTDDSKIARKQG